MSGPVFLSALFDSFRRNANRIALIHSTRSLTYAEVLEEVHRLARALRKQGLSRGDGVAAIADNTPGVLMISLACRVLGCYFVGIPQRAGAAERVRMLEFTEVSALVYEPALSGECAADLARGPATPLFLSLGPGPVGADLLALAAEEPGTPFVVEVQEDDVADLVFTGGSTGGRPKAATYTFERLGELAKTWLDICREDSAEAAAYRAPDSRLLSFLAATNSPGVAVVPTLLHGGALILQQGFDAGAVLRAIEEHRVTVLTLYPSHLNQLLDHPALSTTDVSSLRLLVYYGASASPVRLRQAMARFGPVLCQVYGQTETRMLTVLRPEEHQFDRPELLRSIGRPRKGIEVEVRVGTEPAAVGEVGEIYARSPFRMNHYWREPVLTAEAFIDGWTRTKDLGFLDADGYVHLAGRLRDMVIVNALNCYPVDIENALTTHPGVRDAVVWGNRIRARARPSMRRSCGRQAPWSPKPNCANSSGGNAVNSRCRSRCCSSTSFR